MNHPPGTAACAQPGIDPDLWHSTEPTHRHHAKTICTRCPLLDACRDHALTTRQPHGIWGGLTPPERRRILYGIACGTEAALKSHLSAGEECGECEAAQAARVEAGRREQLAAEHAKGGTVRGYELHRLVGEVACEGCLGAMRVDSERRRRRAGARPRGGVRAAA